MSSQAVAGAELARINRVNAGKILPLLLLGYVLNTLDKNNIGFASLEMNRDLGFTPAVFGLGAGLFFLTYAFLEVPSNLLLRRVGARLWLTRILVTWGLISMGMALVRSELSFYALRLLLGAAEAGWFPGVLYLLSHWFPGAFRARAVMLFFLGAPVAAVVGSPLSGALLTLPTVVGVANWQWLFLIEGLPSILLGIVLFFTLKDRPSDAPWLTAGERARLAAVLAAEKAAGADSHALGSWRDVANPTLLLFCAVNFLSAIGLYGVFIWIPQIIKGFGALTHFQIGLIAAIPFVFASAGLGLSALSSDRLGERKWHTAGMFFIGAMALALVPFSTSPLVAMVFLTVAMTGVFGVQGVFFAMVIEALSARSRISLAAGLALVTTCGNLGGFVGPYGIGLFVQAFGDFRYALIAVACVYVLAALLVALCRRGLLGPAILAERLAPVR